MGCFAISNPDLYELFYSILFLLVSFLQLSFPIYALFNIYFAFFSGWNIFAQLPIKTSNYWLLMFLLYANFET